VERCREDAEMYGTASELNSLEFLSIEKRAVRDVKEMKSQPKWGMLKVNLTAPPR